MPAYSSARYQYEGTETTVPTIYRIGGAIDPAGQVQSRRIDTTANAQWLKPFKAEPFAAWNGKAGVNVTATVYGLSQTGVLPNDDDIWAEFCHLAAASSSLGTIVTTTKANLLSNGTALATDSDSRWLAPDVSLDGFNTLVALSNGNLTVTHNVTTANAGAISTAVVTGGKFYFEMQTQISMAAGTFLGITKSPFTNFGSGAQLTNTTSVQTGVAGGSAVIFTNGVNTAIDLGPPALGDRLCFAIDLTARLAWIRANGGNWNASGTADPATGVGGVTVKPALGFCPHVRFGISTVSTDTVTANFGASAFAHSIPAGFVAWTSSSFGAPFKLTATLTPGQAGWVHGRVRMGKPSATYYIDPQIELVAASGGTVNVSTAYNYQSARYAYEGTETTETTIVRAHGTADPTGQVQSRKIITTANAQWLLPFKAEPYAAWNAVTAGSITATVYGVTASGGLPLNDEIWAEFECLSSASNTLGVIVTTTKANLLATGTSVTSDGSGWSGGGSPFKLTATLTPGPGRLCPCPRACRQGERDVLHRSASLPELTMTLDFSALMHDPIYQTLGVPATLTQGESEAALTVIDNTRPVTINTVGNPAEVRTVGPGAYARVQELTAQGITRAQYIDAMLDLQRPHLDGAQL